MGMIMFNYYLWRRTIHSNNNQRVKKEKERRSRIGKRPLKEIDKMMHSSDLRTRTDALRERGWSLWFTFHISHFTFLLASISFCILINKEFLAREGD